MTYNLKKEYFKHYEAPLINDKPIMNLYNDDDQDIYISERSSIASSSELNQILTPVGRRSPTPLTSLPISIKQPHTIRYPYNELSDGNVLVVTQYQHQQKEEKIKPKDPRKVPNGYGNAIPYPETKSPDHNENYYPYWYHNKGKNLDWISRHRQAIDGQTIPLDSPEPHQPVLITSPMKPQQPPRKSRNHQASNAESHLPAHDNHETNHSKRRSSPRPHLPVKDSEQDEHRIQPMKRTISQRRKLKMENDWTDNHPQTNSNGRLLQDANSLVVTSNSLANRSKNRSKVSDKNASNADLEEIGKYRSPPHHQIPSQPQNTPSIPSHHHNHLHIRRHPPSGTYLTTDVHVVDVSFKKPDRLSNIQQAREPFHAPIPTISNQTTRLPLIMREHHQPKNYSPRFPVDYYGTLARQTQGKNWDEPVNPPRIYKPDPQTRFYDRYLHSIVDKRLAA